MDAAKSWRDRNGICFAGRTGFARIAIEHGVPIVPVVTAGAGETPDGLAARVESAMQRRLTDLVRNRLPLLG